MSYVEPVFRPPSEAHSLILQVTIGCSWNNCTFCEMYTQAQKRFRFKPVEDIERELAAIVESGQHVRRIFLADGDAMTLSFRRLKLIMQAIEVRSGKKKPALVSLPNSKGSGSPGSSPSRVVFTTRS